MFNPGTKVILLASSHRGSTGPKKGSLGFYAQNLCGGKVIYSEEGNFFAQAMDVVFSRYGFEKEYRSEKKPVLAVIPNINTSYGDTSGQLAKMSRRIQSGKNTMWGESRMRLDLPGNTPAVMMAPAGISETNLTECDRVEFLGWLTAVTLTKATANWVVKALQRHHLEKSNHPRLNMDAAFFMRELCGDKDTRWNVSGKVGADREKVIQTLQTARAVMTRSCMEEDLGLLRHRMVSEKAFYVRKRDGNYRKEGVNSCFYSFLFQPHMINRLKDLLSMEYGQEIEELFAEPEAVRGCLLVLSACLERTGKIDGKKAMSVGQ